MNFPRSSKNVAAFRSFYAACRADAVAAGKYTLAAFNDKVKGDVQAFGDFDRRAGLEVNEPRLFAWYAHVNAYGCPPPSARAY
jgi:hypothetical protein